jgi:hypothetical protein
MWKNYHLLIVWYNGILHILANLILETKLLSTCHYVHFTNEKDVTWRKLITCPRSCSKLNTWTKIWTMSFILQLLLSSVFFFEWKILYIIIKVLIIYHIIPTSLLFVLTYSHVKPLAFTGPSSWLISSTG